MRIGLAGSMAASARGHRLLSWRAHGFAPLVALLIPLLFSACTMQTHTFDSDAWKSQRGIRAQDNRRGGMVPSLDASIAVGMPRADVVRLLGEPDSRNAETDTDVYELGVSDLGIDEEYYEIRYQDGNVVSRRWARR